MIDGGVISSRHFSTIMKNDLPAFSFPITVTSAKTHYANLLPLSH
jgi:hypothetical protein